MKSCVSPLIAELDFRSNLYALSRHSVNLSAIFFIPSLLIQKLFFTKLINLDTRARTRETSFNEPSFAIFLGYNPHLFSSLFILDS